MESAMNAELVTVDNFTTPETPALLAEHASAIRELDGEVKANRVEIGWRLTECRPLLKENGTWGVWLQTEFAWDEKTARNFINLFKWSQTDPERVPDSGLPLRSQYALAAPTTPEAAREEVLERTAGGETVTFAEIRKTIRRHRTGRTTPKRKAADPPRRSQDIRCLELENIALRSELEEVKSAASLRAELTRRLPHELWKKYPSAMAAIFRTLDAGEEPVMTANHLRVVQ
jgi:hypothetical protein